MSARPSAGSLPRAAARLATLLLMLAAASAAAQPQPQPTPAVAQAAESQAEPGRSFWQQFELRGRLLARAYSDHRQGASESEIEAENARLELRWRPSRQLRAVVEADFAGDEWLKDAYAAWRPGRYELRAGRFKPPVSPVELSSRLELPASERGLLSEVLAYSFGIAGRREGLQASWDQKGRGLSVAAALFRATSTRGDRVGDEAFDNAAKDWSVLKGTLRVARQVARSEVGLSFDLRPAEPLPGEGYRRLWTAGGDLAFGTGRKGGPRAWLEGFVGSSWQDANAFDGQDTTFVAGRLLAAWRLVGDGRRALFVEPYAMGSLLEPDTSVREDLLWEASAGLHVGALGHLRLVLELQHREISRNAPPALGLLGIGESAPRGRTRLVVQVGGAF